MSTYKLSDVTALNGNPVVQINNSDSVLGAVPGSMVQIGTEQVVFLDSIDIENSQMTLTWPWPYADAVNVECTIAPITAVSSLLTVVERVNQVIANALATYNAVDEITENELIHVSRFNIVADGTDQSSKLETAIASNKVLDFTGVGLVSLLSEVTASNGFRFICRDGVSGITGYDGTGIRVLSGEILVDGLSITGFDEETGDNETNFSAVFARINTGAQLTSVTLNKVKGSYCRALISAGLETSDFMPDITIKTSRIQVTNCTFKHIATPVNWRAKCLRDVCVGNHYSKITGKGRIVSAHKVYLDGLGFGNINYTENTNHLIQGNYFHEIINKTTTGDSSGGNNYECHAVMISGFNAQITHNVVTDCTGNQYDCEAIYTKCRYAIVSENILIDAGTEEAAINLKGYNGDGTATGTSPIGDRGKCTHNIIVFTREQYQNGSELIDLSARLTGIHLTGNEFFTVDDNVIIGANVADIRIDGMKDSKNQNVTVTNNRSYLNKGAFSIFWRGAFQNPVCRGNRVFSPVIPSSQPIFYHTRFLAVSNRGVEYKNIVFEDNLLEADLSDGRFDGKEVAFLELDFTIYDINHVSIKNNSWDVEIGSATPDLRPFFIHDQGTALGWVDDVVASDNRFLTAINTYPFHFYGDRYKTYDVEAVVNNSVSSDTITIFQIPVVDGRSVTLTMQANFSTGQNNEAGTVSAIGNYYHDQGNAVIANQYDFYNFRSAPTGSVYLSTRDEFARIRMAEGGIKPISGKTKVRAVSV